MGEVDGAGGGLYAKKSRHMSHTNTYSTSLTMQLPLTELCTPTGRTGQVPVENMFTSWCTIPNMYSRGCYLLVLI